MFPVIANSEKSEIANPPVPAASSGWVFFDGECPWCTGLAWRFTSTLRQRGFGLAPLQAPWVAERLGMAPNELLEEMKVSTSEGILLGGGDAVAFLAHEIWWAWPLYWAAQLPFGMALLRRAYRWVATRRACAYNNASVCTRTFTPTSSKSRKDWAGWLPLAILPFCAIAIRSQLAPWALMWLLAGSIYFGCKWLTWWPCRNIPNTPSRRFGYLLAWPGMDAEAFLSASSSPRRPALREWAGAILKTVLGGALLWEVARRIPATFPLAQGWTGLLGLVFLLHFGTFQVLSLVWRQSGVDAPPLMHTPALATSLADFWGGRWNMGFHQLARRFMFKPLRRYLSAETSVLLVFLVSGLVHDMVISFPARSGFGLPTAYFLIQAGGLWIERSPTGKKFGLGRGVPGWMFMVAVAAGPAFWLFHPGFILAIVNPFLRVIGAV